MELLMALWNKCGAVVQAGCASTMDGRCDLDTGRDWRILVTGRCDDDYWAALRKPAYHAKIS